MARVRCITEMGMGVDVHGRDATKAAKRAVSDAIRHSSLGFFRMLGKTANDMFVDVTSPCRTRRGGYRGGGQGAAVRHRQGDGGRRRAGNSVRERKRPILIANAAVIVSFDDGKTA